jgi:hypothetical protein
MTAEIAILNRTAVALAADSIVTLIGQKGPKTYDSAEKIFRLSRHQPIGIMIYNNAQFMNVPIEVLVRRFRESLTIGQFKHLIQVWPDFEAFLLGFKHEDDDELDHFRVMTREELQDIQKMLLAHMIERIGQKRKPKGAESAEELLDRKIEERRQFAEELPLDHPFLAEVSEEAFIERYEPEVIGLMPKSLGPVAVTPELHRAVTRMMFAIVKSRIRSPAFTGFVFAGFGSEEIFPTLEAIEVDGVYFGKVRILNRQFVDIDRRGETAAVVPFAEKDMPERFIHGIDRRFETTLEDLAVSLVGNAVDKEELGLDGEAREQAKLVAREQFREGVDVLKRRSAASLNSVVNHLSKKELCEIAYSMVELTSRKRRYSSDFETVGGPIDVAILTRNEGFVWVRRKHYFDEALNPRYREQRL